MYRIFLISNERGIQMTPDVFSSSEEAREGMAAEVAAGFYSCMQAYEVAEEGSPLFCNLTRSIERQVERTVWYRERNGESNCEFIVGEDLTPHEAVAVVARRLGGTGCHGFVCYDTKEPIAEDAFA